MRELLKIISKKLIVFTFVLDTICGIADYSQSFVLSYFGTTPFTLKKVIYIIIAIAISNLLIFICGKLSMYFNEVYFVQGSNEIKKYYFNKLQNMSAEKLSTTHTGFIQKLISNTCEYFYDVIYGIENSIIPVTIGLISMFYMMCKQSIISGIISIVISVLAVYLKFIFLKKKRPYQEKVNKADSKYNATFIDFIQNIMTVKKLNISSFGNKKINENAIEYEEATKKNEKMRVIANGSFTGLMDVLYIVVLLNVLIAVKNGQDGLPYLLFYITVIGKLYSNLNYIVKLMDFYERFNISKKQLDEYFVDNKEISLIKNFDNVKLTNVIFSYTKESTKIVIPEFVLNKGDKISIMGESGQGKTTTMNILSGLYPLENGEMFVNNKKRKNSRLDLVFVSQEVDLFDMSIRENLCLDKKIPDEKLFELLEEAGLKTWISELPDGLDTIVGERGIKLSTGQKQRLNLIRGILIDKDLYFFDEPTSNLDSVSEDRIIKMIDKYMKNKTYVIVTHRPRLSELCNRHYIFEDHIMKEVIKTS